jgi:MFS family permease
MRRTLLTLYLPSLLMAFGQGMVFPVVPLLATEFDVSPGLAAQVVTLITLGRVVGLIPAGIVVDRFGRTQAMASGAMIVTVSAVVAGYAPAFLLLLAAQFFWGIGFSLWQMGREVATIEAVKPSQRGRVMSVLFRWLRPDSVGNSISVSGASGPASAADTEAILLWAHQRNCTYL